MSWLPSHALPLPDIALYGLCRHYCKMQSQKGSEYRGTQDTLPDLQEVQAPSPQVHSREPYCVRKDCHQERPSNQSQCSEYFG